MDRRAFLGRGIVLASAGYLGGAKLAAAARTDGSSLAAAYATLKTGSLWRSYAYSNPGEASKLDSYVAALAAGDTPAPPTLVTATGQGLAGILAAGTFTTAAAAASTRPRYQKGIGLWAAHNPAAAGAQLASAVEVGSWWIMDPAQGGWARYPTASLRATYKIAIEIKNDAVDASQFQWDQSASFVPYNHCDPAWICTKNGQPLHSYNGVDWLGQLGNVAYQNACASAAIGMCQRYGVKALYIDNMHGAVSINSYQGVIPDGYTSDDDWRQRAALPWLMNVGKKLRDAGIYVYANCGDKAKAGEYYDGGDAAYRWWGDIAAAEQARAIVAVDGLLNEFAMQRPNDFHPYRSGGGAWDANAPGWQRLVARAQSLGKDYHGLSYADGGSAERYARGCFLLDADLVNRKSTLWTWTLDDPKLTLDPGGAALGSRSKVNGVDVRGFPAFTVYVNMTTAPLVANGVTVPALDSVFVAR